MVTNFPSFPLSLSTFKKSLTPSVLSFFPSFLPSFSLSSQSLASTDAPILLLLLFYPRKPQRSPLLLLPSTEDAFSLAQALSPSPSSSLSVFEGPLLFCPSFAPRLTVQKGDELTAGNLEKN